MSLSKTVPANQLLHYFHVKAFTGQGLLGNPAGVCIVTEAIPDTVMQEIAAENNLAETAFVQRRDDDSYDLRWFTPEIEVDLCGHATLATAHVLLNERSTLSSSEKTLSFHTRSGLLRVAHLKTNLGKNLLELDFPSRPAESTETPPVLVEAFQLKPLSCWIARDLVVELPDEEAVRSLKPNIPLLKECEAFAVIATARGKTVDFVSRFFAPKAGIPEDPVTGSAHCTLIPFWAERLGKSKLHALQVSQRGGELFCELSGDRVKIAGRAETYLRGQISI